MTSPILRVVVDGAACDEPEEYFVTDSAAVRAAIADWQAACDRHGDGEVTVDVETDAFGLMSEADFIETAANAIAADQAELDELRARWQLRAEFPEMPVWIAKLPVAEARAMMELRRDAFPATATAKGRVQLDRRHAKGCGR